MFYLCIGIIRLSDLTNFCIRSGAFQFRGSITQATITYRHVDTTHTIMLPIKHLYYVNSLNLLLSTDSDTSILRVILNNYQINREVYVNRELQRQILLDSDNRKNLSNREKFKKSKDKYLRTEVVHNTSSKMITCITVIEKRKCFILCTADRHIVSYLYRDTGDGNPNINNNNIDINEVVNSVASSSYSFRLNKYTSTSNLYIGSIYNKEVDMLLTWSGDLEMSMFYLWSIDTLRFQYKLIVNKTRIYDVIQVTSVYDGNYIVSSSNDGKLYVWSNSVVKNAIYYDNDVSISINKFKSSTANQLNKELSLDNILKPVKQELLGHKLPIRSLAFAQNSGLVIGAGFDHEVMNLTIICE